jgi:hypothetical protein
VDKNKAPKEFWYAIDKQDLELVKALCKEHDGLLSAVDEVCIMHNYKQLTIKYGERALHRCVYVTAIAIAEYLIAKGADLHEIVRQINLVLFTYV